MVPSEDLGPRSMQLQRGPLRGRIDGLEERDRQVDVHRRNRYGEEFWQSPDMSHGKEACDGLWESAAEPERRFMKRDSPVFPCQSFFFSSLRK